MNRRNLSRIISYILIIALYNVIFFLTKGDETTSAQWMAYAFVYVAIIASFIAPLFVAGYKCKPESLSTIYAVSWGYSILALVFNLVMVLIHAQSFKLCLIVNLVFFVAYFILLIVNYNVNETVEANLAKVDAEREFVHTAAGRLKVCMAAAKDDATKRVVEKAYDAVRTSPLHTNVQAMQYETEILRMAMELELAVDNDEKEKIQTVTDSIVSATQKRNAAL